MDILKFEKEYWNKGIENVGGVDEAGRGPLAGPVVAACVIFDNEIERVELLGSTDKVEWKHTRDGLHITRPDNKPCEHAYSFKITRKEYL